MPDADADRDAIRDAIANSYERGYRDGSAAERRIVYAERSSNIYADSAPGAVQEPIWVVRFALLEMLGPE